MKTPYTPQPMDVSGIALPEELEPLVERLAENVHDVWASERIRAGWTYGPCRSDARRQTPALVPYSALPESEKRYDRCTATGTLRCILALGFEIRKVTESKEG